MSGNVGLECRTPVVCAILAKRTKLVKIGFSTNFIERLKALQGANADALRVLALGRGEFSDESHLHAQLAHSRVNGEWFRMTPKLLYIVAFANVTKTWPTVGMALVTNVLGVEHPRAESIDRRFYKLCRRFWVEPGEHAENYHRGRRCTLGR